MSTKRRKTLSPGQVITFLSEVEVNGNPLEFPDPPITKREEPESSLNEGKTQSPGLSPESSPSSTNADEICLETVPNASSFQRPLSAKCFQSPAGLCQTPDISPSPEALVPPGFGTFEVDSAEVALFCHGKRPDFESVQLACDEACIGLGCVYISKDLEIWWVGTASSRRPRSRSHLKDVTNCKAKKEQNDTPSRSASGPALRFTGALLQQSVVSSESDNDEALTIRACFQQGLKFELKFLPGELAVCETLGRVLPQLNNCKGRTPKDVSSESSKKGVHSNQHDSPNKQKEERIGGGNKASPTEEVKEESANVDRLLKLESDSSDEEGQHASRAKQKGKQRRRRSLVFPNHKALSDTSPQTTDNPEESHEETKDVIPALKAGSAEITSSMAELSALQKESDETRKFVRMFTKLDKSSQEARRIAAWIFIKNRYPLTPTAEADAKQAENAFAGKEWVDPLPPLPGGIELETDPDLGSGTIEQKKKMILALSPGLERMEKARALEMAEAVEHTQLEGKKVPGGYEYRNVSDKSVVTIEQFHERYMEYVRWRLQRHRSAHPQAPWAENRTGAPILDRQKENSLMVSSTDHPEPSQKNPLLKGSQKERKPNQHCAETEPENGTKSGCVTPVEEPLHPQRAPILDHLKQNSMGVSSSDHPEPHRRVLLKGLQREKEPNQHCAETEPENGINSGCITPVEEPLHPQSITIEFKNDTIPKVTVAVGALYGGLPQDQFLGPNAKRAQLQYKEKVEKELFSEWELMLTRYFYKIACNEAAILGSARLQRMGYSHCSAPEFLEEKDSHQFLATDNEQSCQNDKLKENTSIPNDTSSKASICDLCCDEEHQVELKPCGHNLCNRCADKLISQSTGSILVCPWDRKQITSMTGVATQNRKGATKYML